MKKKFTWIVHFVEGVLGLFGAPAGWIHTLYFDIETWSYACVVQSKLLSVDFFFKINLFFFEAKNRDTSKSGTGAWNLDVDFFYVQT